jgi:hypothetical protein
MIADGHGTPPALSLTGGNRNHLTQLMPLLRGIPAPGGVACRPGP